MASQATKFLAFLALISLGRAAAASESSALPHGVLAGVGNQYGGIGVGYTYRISEVWAAGAGIGAYGAAVNGRVSPIETFRPLYIQIGISPVLVSELNSELVWYGPDLAVGLETKGRPLALNFNIGMGAATTEVLGTQITQTAATFGLGVGINFGESE